MKNHEGMTDGQINWKVHHIVSKGTPTCIKDYCNDVSVAWPIIVESGICINFRNGKTSLVGLYEECPDECDRGGELRSAMICFLEMKDAEVSE